jgi:ABC-2 type transport system permease protein
MTFSLSHELSAVATVAYRDVVKLLRDRPRLFASLVFPVVIVGVLGYAMVGMGTTPFNGLVFIFTGVLAQTLYDSSAMGLISLIEDRESDFSQEIFVAPISRYAIVVGKILGESGVSLVQGLGVVFFSVLFGVQVTLAQIPLLLLVAVFICLVGGAFGLIVMVNLRSRRAAQQVFPLILLPQYFLAGVFLPVDNLQFPLSVLSQLAPLRYAVDLLRGVFYASSPAYGADYDAAVIAGPLYNVLVLSGMLALFLVVGTAMFVRSERNR